MRRTLVFLFALAVLGFGVPIDLQILTSSTTAQSANAKPKPFNLRIAAANGKAAANLPVFLSMSPTAPPIGTTGAQGDIALAADSNKNGKTFNVYRLECNRLVFLEPDSPEDKECKKRQGANQPGDQCGPCAPYGLFTWGQSSTVGQFAGGNPWTGPLAITSYIGAGVATPIIIKTTGSSTSTTGAPPAGTPTAGTPTAPTAPAPPPAPTNFTHNRLAVIFTAAPGTADGACGTFFQPTYSGTGFITVDASGAYIYESTDPTGTTLILRGPGTFNGPQSLTAGTSQPFPWTSATSGWNFQAIVRSGQITADGTGSMTMDLIFLNANPGARQPTPNANCGNQRIQTFRRP